MQPEREIEVFNLSALSLDTITIDDVEPAGIGRAWEQTVQPICQGGVATPWRGQAFTARGEVGRKRSKVTVYNAAGEAVAVIGVCLHSRAAPGLFTDVTGITLEQMDLSVPWLAINVIDYRQAQAVEDWAYHVAWAILLHAELLPECST